jgi:hypothetical protein
MVSLPGTGQKRDTNDQHLDQSLTGNLQSLNDRDLTELEGSAPKVMQAL